MVMPSNQVEIPPDLLDIGKRKKRVGFATYLAIARRDDPLRLYLAQLRDYFRNRIEQLSGKEADIKVKTKALQKEYDDAEEEATFRSKMGDPVETFPYAEEVSMFTVYPNVQRLYQEYLDKLEAQVRVLQRGIDNPEGRVRIEEAINEGVMTPEEAFDENPYWTLYKGQLESQRVGKEEKEAESLAKQKESLKSGVYSRAGLIKLQQEVAKGTITQEEAFDENPYYQDYLNSLNEERRVDLEKRMRAAQSNLGKKAQKWVDQANLEGTTMSEQDAWKKVTEQETADAQTAKRWTPASDTMARLMGEAKEYGIDVSGLTPYNVTPETVDALARKITEAEQGRQSMQSQFLASQYPEQYKSWQTEMTRQTPTIQPGYEKGFYKWATTSQEGDNTLTKMQKDFEKARLDTETANWQQYGPFYGQYQKFLGGITKPGDYQNIEDWIAKTPEMKVAWEEEVARRGKKRAPRAVWK